MEAVNLSRAVKFSLRVARESAGLTQEQAAEACGISVKRMERHEKNSGNLTFDMAHKLIRLYRVPFFEMVHFGPESDLYSRMLEQGVTPASIDTEINLLEKEINDYVAKETYLVGTFRSEIKKMISKGFTGGILQSITTAVNSNPEFNSDEKVATIRTFVRELAGLCKETVTHCGVPSEVSAGWFIDEGYNYIRFSCPRCSARSEFLDRDRLIE
jgi:DNA-binding XRE family transcriptional regulator